MSGTEGARLRAAAATVVDAVAVQGRSLDDALAAGEAGLPAADRPALWLIAYGTIRHYFRIRDWIDALLERPLRRRDRIVNAVLATGLYQLAETRMPDHAVVSASVGAARLLRRPKLAGLVNAVLRRAIRDRIFDAEPSNEEARFDHPRWLIEAIREDWPDDWNDMLAANNQRAPMWLRVNPAHGTADDYRARLEAAGPGAAGLPGVPGALRLDEPVPVDALPGFFEGHVSVQDAAAQLAAPWTLAGVPGRSGGTVRVLDACAAPGGKSGHLKELGGDSIALTCIDVDGTRLAAVGANLTRLGVDATLVEGDASNPKGWWDRSPFDAILVDAPCSATGVIRRHPDIKLNRRRTDVARLAGTQAALLDALWPLLAPGGRLLYVTCSVLAAENDAIVGAFLERHTDARENDLLQDNNIRDLMRSKGRGIQVLPGTAGLDGFYFAALGKVS